MSFFRNISNKFFSDPPPIRPIKNVLPKGTLTDDEVCFYLIDGTIEEQTLTENWLYGTKFKAYYQYKMVTEKLQNLEPAVTFAYDDAVKDTLDAIRSGVYRKEASLRVYFARIFDNYVNTIFRKKATHKQQDERQALAHQKGAIEDDFQNLSIEAIEPNAVKELLDLFEKKEPNKAFWVMHAILGWKDVDFVEAKKATNEGSARSYLVECKKTFEQFLADNGETFQRRKNKKDKPPPSAFDTLILVVLNGLFS